MSNNKVNSKETLTDSNIKSNNKSTNEDKNSKTLNETITSDLNSTNPPLSSIPDQHPIDEQPTIIVKPPIQNKITYLIISTSSGLSQFSSLSIMYYFKDVLQTSPSQLSIINSIILLPLIIKPIFGLISDMYPICGYRRKVYIIICGFVDSLTWIAMTLINHSVISAALCLLISTSCVSFSSSLGEAIAVQLNNDPSLNKQTKNSNITKVFIFRAVGMLFSAILRAVVVQYFSIKTVFIIASILPLLNVLAGFIYIENKSTESSSYTSLSTIVSSNESGNEHNGNNNNHTEGVDMGVKAALSIETFISKIKTKEIIIPLVFLIILTSSPAYMDSSFYYLTEYKNFTPNSLGMLTIVLTIVMILNLLVFNNFLFKIRIKKLIPWSLIFSFLFSSMFNLWILLNMENEYVVYVSISFYVALKQCGVMPIMNLACCVCPEGYEGSIYSLFTSSANLGRTLSGIFGSLMMVLFGVKKGQYDNFNIMVFAQNLISLLPIAFLFCIPSKYLQISNENVKRPLKETVIEVKIEMESANKITNADEENKEKSEDKE